MGKKCLDVHRDLSVNAIYGVFHELKYKIIVAL